MLIIQCQIEGCEYETPDVEPVIADALNTTHATSHRTPSGPTQAARVETVKKPNVSSAGTTEDCQQYLLDYYNSSTFNTCEHQTLPLMEGPPMRLMIDPHASPTAHHSPIPVPLHWQDDVKVGLDRDVRLGVLEPVPIGEPATWYHRMVI